MSEKKESGEAKRKGARAWRIRFMDSGLAAGGVVGTLEHPRCAPTHPSCPSQHVAARAHMGCRKMNSFFVPCVPFGGYVGGRGGRAPEGAWLDLGSGEHTIVTQHNHCKNRGGTNVTQLVLGGVVLCYDGVLPAA
jgi:hypothetical protein